MTRLPDYFLASGATLLTSTALAAPVRECQRGTVTAISGDMLTVHTHDAADVPVALAASTRYVEIVKSSLDQVDPRSHIGTTTKTVGNEPVALEAAVFPPAMRGAGERHYAWDRISDATLSGRAKQITVTYKGGSQVIAVPSNAPNGTLRPTGRADVTPGASIFVNVVSDGGKVTAVLVAVGTDGVKPPM